MDVRHKKTKIIYELYSDSATDYNLYKDSDPLIVFSNDDGTFYLTKEEFERDFELCEAMY